MYRFVLYPVLWSLALGLVNPTTAVAAGPASAEALFDEGRRLLAAGRFEEACEKLEASQRIDRGLGTLLNLGECYERSGRLATAWARFREAASMARAAGDPKREDLARRRVARLEPRLSYLTIEVVDPEGIVIEHDGRAVDAELFGVPFPVDPGDVVLSATAPGKAPFSTKARVGAEGDHVTVKVPALEAVAESDDAGETTGEGAGSPSTQKTWALVAGGAGLAFVAAGSVFGLVAKSTYDEAEGYCDPKPYCGPRGNELSKDALTQADVSTALFVVGAVGLAAGATLWLTAPSGTGPDIAAGIGPGRVSVRGRW